MRLQQQLSLIHIFCVQGFFDALKPLMDAFAEAHNYRWQAGMNGRSGGYLVLYQGETKLSQYKSYCTCCGQRNYRIAVSYTHLDVYKRQRLYREPNA